MFREQVKQAPRLFRRVLSSFTQQHRQHLRGESLQPHELLWLDEGVGLYVPLYFNDCHYPPFFCPTALAFCRYGKDFQRISRRFMPQASPLIHSRPCRPASHRTPQHDPKKLEFIYYLRSRRPGTSGIIKSAYSSMLHLRFFQSAPPPPPKMARLPRLLVLGGRLRADGCRRRW